MKIISLTKQTSVAFFSIISGIGAICLSSFFILLNLNGSDELNLGNLMFFAFLYYPFNSFILFMLGFLLLMKYFKAYAITSILLGVSVTISLFIPQSSELSLSLSNNFFVFTTNLGMTGGGIFGGFILVPMFLIGVYVNLYHSIGYMLGKIDYANNIDFNLTYQNNKNLE